jgi:hypothetical protein
MASAMDVFFMGGSPRRGGVVCTDWMLDSRAVVSLSSGMVETRAGGRTEARCR